MSQTVHALFPCQAGKGADLLAILRSEDGLTATRAFEGCESIEAYTDADNPDNIILWEKFATRANHEAYLAWRIETGLLDALSSILASDLQVTYLDGHPDV
ncbi:MAG: antibiotic biosynthesis monooxygenase family protein [Actinomycetota bacterium]|nr:antibiotic biosynthesis monooxygenase family protein [Actinomycetota bacterium]MEE3353683.1 antibiotic biosynthesis monooxygenase family protein [Actinomycetota bacterium]